MKVLFTNPPWWAGTARVAQADGSKAEFFRAGVRAGSRWPFTMPVRSRPDHFVYGDYLPYPFFLGYAATYAKKHTNASVLFRDSVALRESYDTFAKWLGEVRPDMIVLESATPSWDHDAQLVQLFVKMLPGVRVVITGPITSQADRLLAEHPIHACVRGEYEKGVVKVIEGASGAIGYDMLTKKEMNEAPYPWFDASMARRYFDVNPSGVGEYFPHAHVWSSRGCPFKCIFCVWPATMTGNDPDGEGKRTVRHYSADYMEGFLRDIIGRYGFKSIYFDDDTFNLGNAHVLRMCEVMSRIGVPWTAMCRADTSKMETWKIMADAGCVGVKLGFESGNQFVVDNIVNKHLDLDIGRQAVHECKRVGMRVHGTFTFGLPGETPEQMQDTKRFIESLPFDSCQMSGTAEIEGTPLHTLSQTGTLPAYEAARIDADYDRHTDGNVKFQRLAAALRGDADGAG